MSPIGSAPPDAFVVNDTSAPRPLRRFLSAARGYWTAQGPPIARPLTVGLVAVVIASLGITYSINLWNRHFFDALEARNRAMVAHQALLFPVLIGLYVALCVFAMWARMTMQRTWRAWVNAQLVHSWLAKARFYRLELVGGNHKNPEHRINDDLRIATEMPVDFVTGSLTAALSAVTFLTVLWNVGGALHIVIAGVALSIPGFLVVAAVIYAVTVNGAMLAIAFRFIPVTERKNQAEAEYRYALTRVRENAESIALLDGGGAEEARLNASFGAVVARWRDLMVQHMRAVIVAQGSAQFAGVVPVLLCTPLFLNGRMSLGAVMQVASAFVIVQGALSWFMENYTRLGDWTASARRVAALLAALDAAERSETATSGAIVRRTGHDPGLQFRQVRVTLDGGRPIVAAGSVTIGPGERVLIAGESGSGKSSLLRAIAGCWPWGDGEIVHGWDQRIVVVPQRPYLPAGTLREALTYPIATDRVSADRAAQALAAVGLGALRRQLDTEAAWANILSGGEKQRLAIARLLLHRPDIVALDEVTSALDVAAQAELMDLLARALPSSIIISVGHRPELENFHQRKLVIARGPHGARLVWDGRIVKPAAQQSRQSALANGKQDCFAGRKSKTEGRIRLG